MWHSFTSSLAQVIGTRLSVALSIITEQMSKRASLDGLSEEAMGGSHVSFRGIAGVQSLYDKAWDLFRSVMWEQPSFLCWLFREFTNQIHGKDADIKHTKECWK